MSRLRKTMPPRVSWPWIAGAVGVWLAVSVFSQPLPGLSPGPFEGRLTLTTDVFEGPHGRWALGSIEVGTVLVEVDRHGGRGDVLMVAGTIRGTPGTAAGRRYRGVLDVDEVTEHTSSRFLPHVAGRVIRVAVEEKLAPYDPGRALLAGFLIGDTTRISALDRDAMRRSGLSHFVAVSGSNVVLFLGLLGVLVGPLALGPRRRALVGLAGLPVYVAATRFEPSVMRASTMAAIALVGRLVGVVLEAWQLLAVAIVILALADPSLVSNVGFQLSVAATAGVLIGARWPVEGPLLRTLAVTMCAQLAVAPLLLAHFGSVPLMSPVVNLLAAPLVTGATVLGVLGVIGMAPAMAVSVWLADIVLWLARGAATWPQLSAMQVVIVGGAVGIAVAFPMLRTVVVVTGGLGLLLALFVSTSTLSAGSVAVLDVGQGDAILIEGGGGRRVLVDGGPDPRTLIDRLRTYGVTHLDLVIVTHVHADHVGGLVGIVGDLPIGEVWADPGPHETGAYMEFEHALEEAGVEIVVPHPGEMVELGALQLIVEAPLRRYASPNDQSIVLTVRGPARSMLLSGDVETFAQHDLGALRADVLKVPHHGAATSDPAWLESVGADLAIISVGPNDFGHPSDLAISTLRDTGARVVRTDEVGNVVVDLSRSSEFGDEPMGVSGHALQHHVAVGASQMTMTPVG